jgi:predicted enzyme related to lactoylglutathione lyase
MKTNFLGLRTVIYKTDDINKAKEWYSKVLDIQPYFDEPFYVGFNVGGFELGIQPHENNEASTSGGAYWGVNDVKAKYAELLELGASPVEVPTEVGGGISVASVKDPWGNHLGIIFNPHFNTKELVGEDILEENQK